ncbi:tonB-system energizer ExbB [Hahella ganghwensis]|uniref:tonB-system energizer ExbB n=1 Tax=Hahella ganghwensis TaxID=286420 RepID=UPI000368667E|nr:tonB-system energizer ExbB [Hahella ganghwensis]
MNKKIRLGECVFLVGLALSAMAAGAVDNGITRAASDTAASENFASHTSLTESPAIKNQAPEAEEANTRTVDIAESETKALASTDSKKTRPDGVVTDNKLVLHDLSPLTMFRKADWVVQSVMVILIWASVLSWTVWLVKTLQLRSARIRTTRMIRTLKNMDRLEEAFDSLLAVYIPERQMLEAAQREVSVRQEACIKQSALWPTDSRASLPSEGIKERVSLRLTNAETQQTASLGRGIGILASVSSTAPFVGLFGTVWGIMNSFIGIASTQTTNLAVVAPGIAEALLATAAGLIAAIPAALFYNLFSRKLADYRRNVAEISSELVVLLSRHLDQQLLETQGPDFVNRDSTMRKVSSNSAEDQRHGHVAAAKTG